MNRLEKICSVLIKHGLHFLVEPKNTVELDYWVVSIKDVPKSIFEQVVQDLEFEDIEVTIHDNFKYRVYIV